jgi:hypothetical protein
MEVKRERRKSLSGPRVEYPVGGPTVERNWGNNRRFSAKWPQNGPSTSLRY